jgi:uncharacterized protein (UPF0548 family)
MWSFRQPSEEQVRSFLAAQSQQGFSYREVGSTQSGTPAGFDFDHNRIPLGKGAAVFEAACAALRRWQMFPGPWVTIRPANTPIEVGNVVAMLARVCGLWWVNACRIVYVLRETQPVRRFGFAYGTLPGHVESGEERFTIEWDGDDIVWYDLRAFSRPRYWVVRLGYPLARRLQRRFVVESQAVMRQIVAAAAHLAENGGRA